MDKYKFKVIQGFHAHTWICNSSVNNKKLILFPITNKLGCSEERFIELWLVKSLSKKHQRFYRIQKWSNIIPDTLLLKASTFINLFYLKLLSQTSCLQGASAQSITLQARQNTRLYRIFFSYIHAHALISKYSRQ